MYLKSQLESYKVYLTNIRSKTVTANSSTSTLASLSSAMSNLGFGKKKATSAIPESLSQSDETLSESTTTMPPSHRKTVTYTHKELEKDGVIINSSVPETRRPNVTVAIEIFSEGLFVLNLMYKGRDKPILEMVYPPSCIDSPLTYHTYPLFCRISV